MGHTVFTGNDQNPQKVPKMGVPPPGQFFSKIPEIHPTMSPIFEKKSGEIPPAGPSAVGVPHFFSKIVEYKGWILGTATESCFLQEGAPYITPIVA